MHSTRRWTVERIALVLVVLFVASGAVDAAVRIAGGIADRTAQHSGALDVEFILELALYDDPAKTAPAADVLAEAHGTADSPRASAGELTAWALLELAPWLLGAAILAFLVPILRAAERGDPFHRAATKRMSAVGSLLLVALPLYEVADFATATSALGPVGVDVKPDLVISVTHFIPGLLVLVLAGIFARGAELSEFERQTV
jgi:hypothetical protein